MDPTLLYPTRHLRQGLAPAEVDVETSLVTPPELRGVNGVPRPTSLETTAEDLRRVEVAYSALSASSVTPTSSVVTIDLADELSPVFEFLNAQVAPTRPVVLTPVPPRPLAFYKRREMTRFAPNALEVRLDLLDYFGTSRMPAQ